MEGSDILKASHSLSKTTKVKWCRKKGLNFIFLQYTCSPHAQRPEKQDFISHTYTLSSRAKKKKTAEDAANCLLTVPVCLSKWEGVLNSYNNTGRSKLSRAELKVPTLRVSMVQMGVYHHAHLSQTHTHSSMGAERNDPAVQTNYTLMTLYHTAMRGT